MTRRPPPAPAALMCRSFTASTLLFVGGRWFCSRSSIRCDARRPMSRLAARPHYTRTPSPVYVPNTPDRRFMCAVNVSWTISTTAARPPPIHL
ncbi:hypothetical protein EVAR_74739_1 [Eumeta japonica]|uniref:Uncharacterized protein n=1 Tax=Eumeta variegata TaxID=151549 RepID=A0A4C1SPA1_EUMVA|nr:hypothetical protein EVAR_74739_1 [Eumeta japonica]